MSVRAATRLHWRDRGIIEIRDLDGECTLNERAIDTAFLSRDSSRLSCQRDVNISDAHKIKRKYVIVFSKSDRYTRLARRTRNLWYYADVVLREVSVHARRIRMAGTLFKYWDTLRRDEGYWSFHGRFFIGKVKIFSRYHARERSSHKRLFEQDLVTRSKSLAAVPRFLLSTYLSLPPSAPTRSLRPFFRILVTTV